MMILRTVVKLHILVATLTSVFSRHIIKLQVGNVIKTIEFSSMEDLSQKLKNDEDLHKYFEQQVLSGKIDGFQTTVFVENQEEYARTTSHQQEQTTTLNTKTTASSTTDVTTTEEGEKSSAPDECDQQPLTESCNLTRSGWTKSANAFWYKLFSKEKKIFSEAEKDCRQHGARLASSGMRVKEIKDEVLDSQNFTKSFRGTWIGLEQIGDSNDYWIWSDGVLWTSENVGWKLNPEEPNNDEEKCGALDAYHEFNFSDFQCSGEQPYLCEKILDSDMKKNGWNISSNGTWIKTFEEEVDYATARENCTKLGGRLTKSILPNSTTNYHRASIVQVLPKSYNDRCIEDVWSKLDTESMVLWKRRRRCAVNGTQNGDRCIVINDGEMCIKDCEQNKKYSCEIVKMESPMPSMSEMEC